MITKNYKVEVFIIIFVNYVVPTKMEYGLYFRKCYIAINSQLVGRRADIGQRCQSLRFHISKIVTFCLCRVGAPAYSEPNY